MVKCKECGNILSDGYIIKATSVIQIDYIRQLCNVKCRKCKSWQERLPLSELIKIELTQTIK